MALRLTFHISSKYMKGIMGEVYRYMYGDVCSTSDKKSFVLEVVYGSEIREHYARGSEEEEREEIDTRVCYI